MTNKVMRNNNFVDSESGNKCLDLYPICIKSINISRCYCNEKLSMHTAIFFTPSMN